MILVLCNPRSGSSMVTGVIALHGFKPGTSKGGGYENYEDVELKRLIRQVIKEPKDGGPYRPTKEETKIIHDYVKSKPDNYIFKTSAELYPYFKGLDPKIILVKRDKDQNIKSFLSRRRPETGLREQAEKVYAKRMKIMDRIHKDKGAPWVDSDELIAGDYQTIIDALEYCGINPDLRKIVGGINKNLWHVR